VQSEHSSKDQSVLPSNQETNQSDFLMHNSSLKHQTRQMKNRGLLIAFISKSAFNKTYLNSNSGKGCVTHHFFKWGTNTSLELVLFFKCLLKSRLSIYIWPCVRGRNNGMKSIQLQPNCSLCNISVSLLSSQRYAFNLCHLHLLLIQTNILIFII
jgi:hypothetical protein